MIDLSVALFLLTMILCLEFLEEAFFASKVDLSLCSIFLLLSPDVLLSGECFYLYLLVVFWEGLVDWDSFSLVFSESS